MRVLITGAGLFGVYAARELIHSGVQVTLLDQAPNYAYIRRVIGEVPDVIVADISALDQMSQLFRNKKFDAVVHTAALLKTKVDIDPWRGFNTNVVGTAVVAETARKAGVKHFVLVSSLSVYDLTLSCEAIDEAGPLRPEGLYDATKLMSETWLREYWKGSELTLTILRPSGTFGYGKFSGGAWMGKMLQDKLLAALSRIRKPIEIRESDFGTNEYLYIKDAAAAIKLALERRVEACDQAIYNIGSGQLVSTQELSVAVKQLLPDAEIEYVPDTCSASYLKRSAALSLKAAEQAIGYNPKFSNLKLALSDYLEQLCRDEITLLKHKDSVLYA